MTNLEDGARDGVGIILLFLSLLSLGSWRSILRLGMGDLESSTSSSASATHESARFIDTADSSIVTGTLYRTDLQRNQCFTKLDWSMTYFVVSLCPFLYALILAEDSSELMKGVNAALLFFAFLGGFLMAFGQLIWEWSASKHGKPMPSSHALQLCLSVFIATFTNFQLESYQTHKHGLLVVGVILMLAAIVVEARFLKIQMDLSQRVNSYRTQRKVRKKAQRTAAAAAAARDCDDSSYVLEREDASASATFMSSATSLNVSKSTSLVHRVDENTESQNEEEDSKPLEKPKDTRNQLHHGAKEEEKVEEMEEMEEQMDPHADEDEAPSINPVVDEETVDPVLRPPSNRSILSRLSDALSGDSSKDSPAEKSGLERPIGMVVGRKQTCTEIIVAIASGLAFGFSTPCFVIAANDPFGWSGLVYKTMDDILLVARTNLFFGFIFWLTTMVGAVLEFHLESRQEGGEHPMRDLFVQYLQKNTFSEREKWSVMAGVVASVGTIFKFQGGKMVGFAQSEMVQAESVVSTIWAALVFKDIRKFDGYVSNGFYALYLLAILFYALSGVVGRGGDKMSFSLVEPSSSP